MAASKRKTLPKDFDEMLASASLDALQAVFDRCELEATGGYGKQTALGFSDCPDELVRWLVAQGGDVNAPDTYRRTPLHQRASFGQTEQIGLLLGLGAELETKDDNGCTPLHLAAGSPKPDAVRALLAHGADVHAVNRDGDTPLMGGLRRTRNIDIENMTRVAALLLDAGAEATPEAREEVERIGKEFEFHREGFNPDSLAATDAALAELYRLFGAAAAPGRQRHDGVSRIDMPEGDWPAQHEALWALLVPSSGAARADGGEKNYAEAVASAVRDFLDMIQVINRKYRFLHTLERDEAAGAVAALARALPPDARRALDPIIASALDD